MKPDLTRGPAEVANALVQVHLQSRRCGKTYLMAARLAAASGKPVEVELAQLRAQQDQLRQRLRRANFIAENGLSGPEAMHIPLDFDPAKEAGSP